MKARYFLLMLFIVASVLTTRANDANWDYNPYAFQYDMSVYVALSTIDDKSITDASDYQIAAFCGEECRGIAEEKIIGEHKYGYLRIRSNQTEGESINFKVKDSNTGKIAKVIETIEFESQQTIGYPSTPFAINARNPYSVTFVIDGVEHRSDLFFGDEIDMPTNTNKEGYTFVGWSPEVDATVPDHDVTYTATYTINQYTITFDTDGGSEIAPITQEYDSAITPPANPTKVGHTFTGWDKEIPLTMPAEDITIKALWTINQYTITFDTDGGSEIAPITQDYNSAVTPPANPTKVGHTFAGWDKEIPLNIPAEDITIKALWTINQYTITFDTDGGSEIAPITQDYNSVVTPPANPTKVGHTFVGWDKEIPLTMPAENITIKALWTVNQYKVSFVADGTVISEETLAYGSRIAPPEAPEKEGHTFAGWKDVPETMPAHDIEIHGSYTVNVYTLTYQVDGKVYKEYTIAFGTEIVPEAFPEKEGYTFSGWQGLPDTMPAHDVVVSGTFAINSYRAVFIIGEDVIETRAIVFGQPVTLPEAPEKEGHTFAGWQDVPETMPAHDIDIYGTYTVNAYTLTYQIDGKAYKEYIVEYGTVIVPEAFPEKEGHTFSGWEGLPQTMPAHDVVVSGTFAINSYRAVFIIGEDMIETRTIVYGQPVTPPDAPEKEGHTFAGWQDLPETMPAHDIEIYGTYTVNAYTLTYQVDGKVYKEYTVAYGTEIVPEAFPEKEGHTFSGWEGLPQTMPAHDVVVSGTFAINSYRAVFIIGEDVIETRTIVYGQPVTTPEAPEKEGHTFAGWRDVPETMPPHDIEIYGTYTVNAYKLTVFLDGAIYMEEMLEYGTPITIPDPEVPDGKQFNGWMTEVPETMPAHDLEIYGTTSEKTGISSIVADEQTEVSIYDMKGNLLFKNIPSKGISNKLSKGLYIINGKKVLIH